MGFSLSSLGSGLGWARRWAGCTWLSVVPVAGLKFAVSGGSGAQRHAFSSYFILEALGALGLGVESFNGPVLRGLRPVVAVGLSKLYS